MTHPTNDQLQRYHDRELPVLEQAEIEQHVGDCRPCTDYLSQLSDLSAWFNQVDLPMLTAGQQQRMKQAWYAAQDSGVRRLAGWFSAVAAAVIAGLMLFTPAGNASQASAGTVAPTYVETVALMQPNETHESGDPQVVQVAQWMASDLSVDGRQ